MKSYGAFPKYDEVLLYPKLQYYLLKKRKKNRRRLKHTWVHVLPLSNQDPNSCQSAYV